MAEDLHVKAYFKSKIDKRMNSFDAFSDSDEFILESTCLFYGRNYDFFSIFGSRRGNFKEADADGYGIYPELKIDCATEVAILEDECSNNYSFRWFTFSGLQKMLKKYKASLKQPKEFFDEDSDERQDIEEGIFDYDSWEIEIKAVVEMIDTMLLRLRNISTIYNSNKEFYNKYFDLNGIIFQVWLDS